MEKSALETTECFEVPAADVVPQLFYLFSVHSPVDHAR